MRDLIPLFSSICYACTEVKGREVDVFFIASVSIALRVQEKHLSYLVK